tara:strand:- start:786 stop:1010 length:225 start_codon:yes stop_codon:yes gene_type:complete
MIVFFFNREGREGRKGFGCVNWLMVWIASGPTLLGSVFVSLRRDTCALFLTITAERDKLLFANMTNLIGLCFNR